MNTLFKIAGAAGLFATAALTVAATSFAGDTGVGEKQAIVTDLGGKAAAVTYWVQGTQGYEVITTVDAAAGEQDARPAVLRVSATLQPGQQQVISVPGAEGSEGAALRISRVANRIHVEKVAALTY